MAVKNSWNFCPLIAGVYETRDYGLFKEMPFNRDVTEKRVTKLIASFSEKEILCPIVINEKWEVIDGQGRFEALKRLNRPIKFVVAEGASIDDCRRMNVYNSNWSAGDFILSYAKSGNKNYIEILDCAKQTGLSYMRILVLASKTEDHRQVSLKIGKGKLVFTADDNKRVRELKHKMDEIKEALLIPTVSDTLMRALKVAMETKGYDHKRMISKCEYCRSNFKIMFNLKDMLIELTRVYNYRVQTNHLYFEDYMRNKGRAVNSYVNIAGNAHDYTDNVKTLIAASKKVNQGV